MIINKIKSKKTLALELVRAHSKPPHNGVFENKPRSMLYFFKILLFN